MARFGLTFLIVGVYELNGTGALELWLISFVGILYSCPLFGSSFFVFVSLSFTIILLVKRVYLFYRPCHPGNCATPMPLDLVA